MTTPKAKAPTLDGLTRRSVQAAKAREEADRLQADRDRYAYRCQQVLGTTYPVLAQTMGLSMARVTQILRKVRRSNAVRPTE